MVILQLRACQSHGSRTITDEGGWGIPQLQKPSAFPPEGGSVHGRGFPEKASTQSGIRL
jgi:hypothetical protein